jgi:hypothetical protein
MGSGREGVARRGVVVGVAVLLTVGAAAGCTATAPSGADRSTTTEEDPMTARPSMEEMVDRYEEMQRAIVAALEADPGGLTWESDAETTISRSACVDGGPDAEAVYFPTLVAYGSYDGAARERFAAVVQEVAGRYDFTRTGEVVDRPASLDAVLEDPWGGRLHLGTGKNSTLLVITGCHEWSESSAAGAVAQRAPVIP